MNEQTQQETMNYADFVRAVVRRNRELEAKLKRATRMAAKLAEALCEKGRETCR